MSKYYLDIWWRINNLLQLHY